MRRAFAALIALALASFVGCGPPALGEECDEPYVTDACEEGLVCAFDGVGSRCLFAAVTGDPCTAEGHRAECVDPGDICGKDKEGTPRCLDVCDDDSDCVADYECNGVEGTSIKGCRRK